MASSSSSANPALQRPTKVRYMVVVFAVILAIITYIDRVALSQAAPQISRELSLSKTEMGWVFFAFITAYALFEIPSGYLGDSLGPRKVLMRIVVSWSIFVAATGQVFNWISLMIVQTLFGAGEAGAFPNIAKAFSVWLPAEERVRAQGIIWLFARWGGAFTPLLVFGIFQIMSWRVAFGIFGLLGAVWAVFFYRWFKDRPADNPSVNAAELELLKYNHVGGHGSVPWAKFAASKQVWLLGAQYFCLSYSWYFSITWLPTYLREARHMDPKDSLFPILAGLPLFLGGIGCLFSGFIAKPLANMLGSTGAARRTLGCLGFLMASSLIVLSTFLENPIPAVIALAFASFSNDLVMPGSWGACMDVGGKYAGTLSGTMNMMGNLGGAVASAAAPYILGWANNDWNKVLYVAAGVYFVGTFFWLTVDPVTPLEKAEAHHA
jgi:MFS transporter, ACS family, glucarate transporter